MTVSGASNINSSLIFLDSADAYNSFSNTIVFRPSYDDSEAGIYYMTVFAQFNVANNPRTVSVVASALYESCNSNYLIKSFASISGISTSVLAAPACTAIPTVTDYFSTKYGGTNVCGEIKYSYQAWYTNGTNASASIFTLTSSNLCISFTSND